MCCFVVCFFKQKTAYEMRISDWSSDVCSSDLNPNQGSFIIEQLTDLVEEAVLAELERISERGGVLGAMETGYQRGRIQDESMRYEQRKHDGTLPLVGVNTFLPPDGPHDETPRARELARSTEIGRAHV